MCYFHQIERNSCGAKIILLLKNFREIKIDIFMYSKRQIVELRNTNTIWTTAKFMKRQRNGKIYILVIRKLANKFLI